MFPASHWHRRSQSAATIVSFTSPASSPAEGRRPNFSFSGTVRNTHFGVRLDEIPALGKNAAEFTKNLLIEGKPRVFTHGYMGEKVEKVKGRPQRYFALVEVTAPDGKRRMLHELLLEAGMARAHGVPAAWPETEVKRLGETKAKERFMRELETLENKARRDRLGDWKKAG